MFYMLFIPSLCIYLISIRYPVKSWTIIGWLKQGLNDKVPRNYFTPFWKIVRTAVAGNADSKRLESIYAKTIVIGVIVIVFISNQQVKNMTIYRIDPDCFLSSLWNRWCRILHKWYSRPTLNFLRLAGLRVKIYACKSSSASSNRPGYYNIKQLERKIIGRSKRFGRSRQIFFRGEIINWF